MITCIKRPVIGIDGNCGFEGLSGRNLNEFNISLKKVANVTDDLLQGKELMAQIENSAIEKLWNDIKLIVNKEFALMPIYDVVSKFWDGAINNCKVFDKNTPIGLKIENNCKDNYRTNRLDWIELYVDNDFTVEAVIQDGFKETKKVLEFKRGLNRKEINYTFENNVGTFWMRLCNGAKAYQNESCKCTDTGHCGCNKCANVYAWEMVEGGTIPCEEPTQEWLDDNGFATLEEYELSLGYQDTLVSGTSFLEPKCQAASMNIFGYQVSCLCSYDWLLCYFQDQMTQGIMIGMGIQIFEKSLQTERFNEYWEGAKENADYYLKKWLGGVDKFTGVANIGEYKEQVKYISSMIINFLKKSKSPCLQCRPGIIIETSIP